ncbi:hypothetical protein ACFV0C_04825 [Streptomyces sp. NPDC059568]|uniref:hypothetical protein n=1 Tax=unclassified Streptomyces TaxID=2593676 RepID=UPI00365AA469
MTTDTQAASPDDSPDLLTAEPERLPTSGESAADQAAFVMYIRAHRIFQVRAFISQIGVNSAVLVSLTEVDGGLVPFIGSASMKVYNVAPRQGFVDIRGEIDWDDDLLVRVTMFVA